MRRTRPIALALLALAVLAVLAARSWVKVDETESVLITEFGRPVVLYGSGEAGFHLKLPWQSTQAIDRRLQVFDPPSREMITGDKRNLEVASYVVWRVADPNRFLRSAGTLSAAEARLDERVSAALSNAISRRDLASLASTDPNVWSLDTLSREVLGNVSELARAELGVDVVDVRLRRFIHPVEVRPAVFDLIRSERRKVAATLRAEGEAQYQTLTSQADRERDGILARADADAERLRGRGDADATRVLNEAHARDPKFYEFLRMLETYRAILDEKATVVLSSGSPLLRLFTQGPADELLKESPPQTLPSPSPPPAATRAAGVATPLEPQP
jgi:modulator of FtsH protease HflC